MSKSRQPSDDVRATITGNVSGQIAVGKGIQQTQGSRTGSASVTENDLAELRQLFAELKQQVKTESPPEQEGPALDRLDELEQAVTAETPDLTTMQYVKQWFSKHLPTLAEAVTSVVIHPLVGRVVGAAGDTLEREFRRRFGPEP